MFLRKSKSFSVFFFRQIEKERAIFFYFFLNNQIWSLSFKFEKWNFRLTWFVIENHVERAERKPWDIVSHSFDTIYYIIHYYTVHHSAPHRFRAEREANYYTERGRIKSSLSARAKPSPVTTTTTTRLSEIVENKSTATTRRSSYDAPVCRCCT